MHGQIPVGEKRPAGHCDGVGTGVGARVGAAVGRVGAGVGDGVGEVVGSPKICKPGILR